MHISKRFPCKIMAMIIVFFGICISSLSIADTTVSTNIITDTTWTKSGSPYIVTTSIDIYPGVTLTIDPGVTIKLYNDSLIGVYGGLKAQGTQDDMIIFTSNNSGPTDKRWRGILFFEEAIGSNFDENGNYLSGSIFEFCEVSYAQKYYSSRGIESMVDLFISNCMIKYISGWGIKLYENTNSIIRDNEISDCELVGIYNKSKALIENNTITNNGEKDSSNHDSLGGGIANFTDSTEIRNNSIMNNAIWTSNSSYYASGAGIYNEGDFVIVEGNTFSGNRMVGLRYRGSGIYNLGTSTTIRNNLFSNNYWGDEGSPDTNRTVDPIYNMADNCLISKNNFNNNYKGGIFNYGSATIINFNFIEGRILNDVTSTIDSNTITADRIQNYGIDAIMTNNILQNAQLSNFKDAVIRNNVITTGDEYDGLCIRNDGYSNIEDNDISGCVTGIQTTSLKTFTGNNLYNNSLYNLKYEDITDQSATNNYWGTTNTSEIMNKIYDYWDDITLGQVMYDPIATSPFIVSIDSDGDGLPNSLEESGCTDFTDADTDDDGIIDGEEDANQDGVVNPDETNPCEADSDSDGIQDGTELGLTLADVGSDTDLAVFVPDEDPSTTTDALLWDTDGDGISDGVEDADKNGRVDEGESNPNVNESISKPMPWIPLLLLNE